MGLRGLEAAARWRDGISESWLIRKTRLSLIRYLGSSMAWLLGCILAAAGPGGVSGCVASKWQPG